MLGAMSRNLIIFIDSFPFSCLEQTNFLSSLKNKCKVTPGFGYSVNVKAELFGGYIPDAAGYLNEWTYQPQSSLKKYRAFLKPMSYFSKLYYLDRALHKALSKFLRRNLLNIPFEYLGYFDKWGVNAYEDDFPLPTIFTKYPFVKILYPQFSAGENRDELIFEQALNVIRKKEFQNLFIASADLDHITHVYGVGTEEHSARIALLDSCVEKVVTIFFEIIPNGSVYILSDHGMANVHGAAFVDLERHFGKANEESYLYFIDSTILRCWCFEPSLKTEIEQYLNEIDVGRVLNETSRYKYGITSRTFGDIILLIDEGFVFQPSFFGKGLPKAMHGYQPELDSQQGIFVCNQNKQKIASEGYLRAPEVFSLFNQAISNP